MRSFVAFVAAFMVALVTACAGPGPVCGGVTCESGEICVHWVEASGGASTPLPQCMPDPCMFALSCGCADSACSAAFPGPESHCATAGDQHVSCVCENC